MIAAKTAMMVMIVVQKPKIGIARFHPERVGTTQPRVAQPTLGTEQTLTFSTLKGLYNLPRFVCNPFRVEIIRPRSFPRVRWRDSGLCCSTPSAYFLAG